MNFPVLFLCFRPRASTLPPHSSCVFILFPYSWNLLSETDTMHVMSEKKGAFNILGHAFPSAPLSQLFKEVKRIWQCLGFGNVG